MGFKKRLNYAQMWVFCKTKGLDINDYKHLRPRVSKTEAIILDKLKSGEACHWEGHYCFIKENFAQFGSEFLPLTIEGATLLSVKFWYELDGTYKVVEFNGASKEELKEQNEAEKTLEQRKTKIFERQVSELKEALVNKQDEVEALQSILDIKNATSNIKPYEIKLEHEPTSKDTVSISLFSDWHCDEVVEAESVMFKNEYNKDVAKKRAENYFINLVKLITHHQKNYRIKRHVLALLGDNIGGYIHEELRQTNSMSPLEAIAFAKTILFSCLEFLDKHLDVDIIDVVGIVGNHPRTTEKLPYNNLTQTSYEYFLYKDLEEMCKLKGMTKFNFIIPKASMAILSIFGKNYAFVHGNGFKFLGGIGGLYIPLLKYYARLNATFNIERLFFGHYHTTIDIKQAVGNGSLKGYDSFAMGKALDFEVPQQSLVLLNEKRGFTNFQSIYLD